MDTDNVLETETPRPKRQAAARLSHATRAEHPDDEEAQSRATPSPGKKRGRGRLPKASLVMSPAPPKLSPHKAPSPRKVAIFYYAFLSYLESGPTPGLR